MNTLEKLALPYFNNKILGEINYCKSSYEVIDGLKDNKANKDNRKKKILSVAFESISGLFNLSYDEKLVFSKDELDSIYIENILDMSFNDAFFKIYEKSFYKYLSNIHTLLNNRVDSEMYTLAKLAYLNDDQIVISKLAQNSYMDLFEKIPDLISTKSKREITKEDKKRLILSNKERISKLKEIIKTYKYSNGLSLKGIRDVYMCFSKDVFDEMTKEEKVHLSNLLYNYHSNQPLNMSKKYSKIISKSSTNKDCMNIIINDLLLPGRTMLIMKKNKDLIKDFISGIDCVYMNETKKVNLNSLDDLKDIKKVTKR